MRHLRRPRAYGYERHLSHLSHAVLLRKSYYDDHKVELASELKLPQLAFASTDF